MGKSSKNLKKRKQLVKIFYKSDDKEKLLKDKQFVFISIAKNHPRAEKKKLNKVTKVVINNKGNGVKAVLGTGMEIDFSLNKALKSRDDLSYIKNKVAKTFRNEIKPQIYEFRKEKGYIKKPEYHVGHVGEKQFQALFVEFSEKHQLIFDKDFKIKYCEYKYCEYCDTNLSYFKDKELSSNWKKYHKENAKLEMQPEKENLQQEKQKVDVTKIFSPELLKMKK